jgi:hypothetical protein
VTTYEKDFSGTTVRVVALHEGELLLLFRDCDLDHSPWLPFLPLHHVHLSNSSSTYSPVLTCLGLWTYSQVSVTTGVHSEGCIITLFCHCVNVIGYTMRGNPVVTSW